MLGAFPGKETVIDEEPPHFILAADVNARRNRSSSLL